MVIRVSDKKQNYNNVTKLLVKPLRNDSFSYSAYNYCIKKMKLSQENNKRTNPNDSSSY